jgi:hypothetical protein
MRIVGHLLSFTAGAACAIAIFAALSDSTSAPDSTTLVAGAAVTATPTPSATPLPSTWIEALQVPRGPQPPQLLTCLDTNDDARLNAADGSYLFASIDVPLVPAAACGGTGHGADFYESALLSSFNCNHAHRPLFFVVIAGGGSDLLAPEKGDSLGLIDITNKVFARAEEIDMPATLTLSSGAIVGAEMAQSNLEEMLAAYVANRLALVPCARAVLIGHSHGGVTVSTVTSMLDQRFEDRLLGILIDRSNVIYDRPAENFPERVPLYNFFQTNEGWHGVAIDRPNIANYDESDALAPNPLDGGGGQGIVTHRSLDDSPAVQERLVNALIYWATQP